MGGWRSGDQWSRDRHWYGGEKKGHYGDRPYVVCSQCDGWAFKDRKLAKCKLCNANFVYKRAAGKGKGEGAVAPESQPDRDMGVVLRAIRDMLSKDPGLSALAHSFEEIAKPFDSVPPHPAPAIDSDAFKQSSAQVQKASALFKKTEQQSIAIAKKVEVARAELERVHQQMAENEAGLQEARTNHTAEINRHLAAFPKGCPVDAPKLQVAEPAASGFEPSGPRGPDGADDVDTIRAKAQSLKEALAEEEAALARATKETGKIKKRKTDDKDTKSEIEAAGADAAMAAAEQLG